MTDPVDYSRQLVQDWWHAKCKPNADNPAHAFNPNLRRPFHDEPLGWQHARNPLQLLDGGTAWNIIAASILSWHTSRPKAEPVLRRLLILGVERVAELEPLRLETELRPAGQIRRRPKWLRTAARFLVASTSEPADCEVEQLQPAPDVGVDWQLFRRWQTVMPNTRQQARVVLIRALNP